MGRHETNVVFGIAAGEGNEDDLAFLALVVVYGSDPNRFVLRSSCGGGEKPGSDELCSVQLAEDRIVIFLERFLEFLELAEVGSENNEIVRRVSLLI